MTVYKDNDVYVDDRGVQVKTYRRSFEYKDLTDGETKSVDDLMVEVEAHQFVNETSARRIGFIEGHFRDYEARNDNQRDYFAEHHPRMKGDHEYRTNTTFARNEDGAYTLCAIIPAKDEPVTKIIRAPDDRAAGREFARKKATVGKRAITRLRNKLDKRQSIGDPNCVLSRDEDFPLLAVLRRDKRVDLITAVLQYRQLVALCEAEPLKGQAYGGSDADPIEYLSKFEDGELIHTAKARRSNGSYNIPSVRARASVINDRGEQRTGRTESLHVKLNEDVLADYIDKKPVLARIRSALGPLLEPVEDAVLGGRTMQEVGEAEGLAGTAASLTGKGLVYRGLTVLDGFFGFKNLEGSNDNYLIIKKKIA